MEEKFRQYHRINVDEQLDVAKVFTDIKSVRVLWDIENIVVSKKQGGLTVTSKLFRCCMHTIYPF